jgi:hypothetical protein
MQDTINPVDPDILEFEQRIISSMYEVEANQMNTNVHPELDDDDYEHIRLSTCQIKGIENNTSQMNQHDAN